MYLGYGEPAMSPGRDQAPRVPWVVDAARPQDQDAPRAAAEPDGTAEDDD